MRDRTEENPEKSGESAPDSPPSQRGGDLRLPLMPLGAALVLFAAFVIAVYAYAHAGGPWVDRQDEQIGEIVANRARRLAEAGMAQQAIELYRESLTLPFDDSTQPIWVMRRLAGLLLENGQFDGTLEVARDLLDLSDDYGRGIFAGLIRTLDKAKRPGKAMEMAQAWFATGEEKELVCVMGQAQFYMGMVYQQRGHSEEAAAAFLRAYDLCPTTTFAWAGARAAHKAGRTEDAMPLVDFVIQNESGPRTDAAKELKREMEGIP